MNDDIFEKNIYLKTTFKSQGKLNFLSILKEL